MAANLKGLIKLRKYNVEEKQKVLSALFREHESIDAKKNGLLDTIARERAIAEEKNSYETHASYILYAERAREQIEGLNGKLRELNVKIRDAQEDMRVAFGELKKIEIIQKNREDEDRKELDRKESLMLDEMGLEIHRRKEN